MVSASLVWFRFTCGDNSHFLAPQRVRDDQQAALHHAKKNQAVLAVVRTVVYEIYREWITKGLATLLEAHAVLGEIGRSLCIIPSKSSEFIDYGLPVASQ